MTYTLGIDLHKRSSVWVLINNEKEVVKKLTVPSTRAAIPGAVAELGIPTQALRTAIEPVCGWRWYAEELEKYGLAMSIANPSQVRLIADSKQKHDAYDARMLAELLHINYLPTAYRAPADITALRSLVRERAFFVQLQTGIKFTSLAGYLAANEFQPIFENSYDMVSDPGMIRIKIKSGARSLTIDIIVTQKTCRYLFN